MKKEAAFMYSLEVFVLFSSVVLGAGPLQARVENAGFSISLQHLAQCNMKANHTS